MSRYEVLKCDQCRRECKAQEAVNWLEITIVGIDVRTYDDYVMTGTFCAKQCVIDHLNGKPVPMEVSA